jgi:glutathione reductase (NADPH)
MQEFDFLVIGGGSGGVRAARMAAQKGQRVAIVESAAWGGTCVNLGCIPKKLYSYAAHFAADFADSAGYGWQFESQPRFDWNKLKENRRQEITRLNGIYVKLLQDAGVTLLTGFARLIDAHSIAIGEQHYRATTILIATGGTPSLPQIPGAQFAITSNEIFDLPSFPKRLLVVGGGYIASEFASIFHGLGAQVTQLYRGEQILRGFDDDVRNFLADEVKKAGVDLRLQTDCSAIAQTADGLQVSLTDGSVVMADAVLYAIGRVPMVANLGLTELGIAQKDDGAIIVNQEYQTNLPSIYALGDVTARMQLTPVALGEAMQLVDHLFGSGERKMAYDYIPTAVFTHPNIGTVGYSEAQARKQFGNIKVYVSQFKALKHTLSGSTERSMMKLIVETATDRVVGLHMVGSDAGEIVQGFAVAMKAGATKAVFDSTIGIHPTAAEEFVTMRTVTRT